MKTRNVATLGYTLFETADYAVIATLKSDNRKTGRMIQVWILHRSMSPVAAVACGADAVVCGNCIHRKNPITGKRSCYVNVGQGPNSVYRAYKNGRYPFLPMSEYPAVFSGKKVRFGAYGDPVLIPVAIVESVAALATKWTGYTHQWNMPKYQTFSRFFMASVDSETEYSIAKTAGWRTFRVLPKGANKTVGEIVCPSESKGRQCVDCTLCNGSARPTVKDIIITVHGTGKSNFVVLQ